MGNTYSKLISNTNKEIKAIRQKAQDQILKRQLLALTQAECDFTLLGWKKYWTKEQLTADGQFERLEQSVIDTKLKLVGTYKRDKIGIVDDQSGSMKYRMRGVIALILCIADCPASIYISSLGSLLHYITMNLKKKYKVRCNNGTICNLSAQIPL